MSTTRTAEQPDAAPTTISRRAMARALDIGRAVTLADLSDESHDREQGAGGAS